MLRRLLDYERDLKKRSLPTSDLTAKRPARAGSLTLMPTSRAMSLSVIRRMVSTYVTVDAENKLRILLSLATVLPVPPL